MSKYLILAFYHFTSVDDPQEEVRKHHAFFQDRDVKGRIYISKQGINGQMSAATADAEEYMQWLVSDPRFAKVDFKYDPYHEHVFPKTTVKVREQLAALDTDVDVSEGGVHVAPEAWGEMLQKRDENTLLLDVRNAYEWEIGHFDGADLPTLEQFREFPDFAKKLKEEKDPEQTKVMMYCTGGIRCEMYSALLKKEGFKNVFQLQGGVINYGHKEGTKHWKGKLFVFDDRLAVPISPDNTEIISSCTYCDTLSDVYYNCANMDCNELFFCCLDCLRAHKGCCCDACLEGRVRPYKESAKPFRRMRCDCST